MLSRSEKYIATWHRTDRQDRAGYFWYETRSQDSQLSNFEKNLSRNSNNKLCFINKVREEHAGVVPNSDPHQITTPLVLVGLGLGLGEGLGLSNQVAISTRGGNNLAGIENGHNTGTSYRQSRRLPRASGF